MLTSKLIYGTFPDYGRVIPAGNDKALVVDKKEFEAGGGPRLDRVRASAAARSSSRSQRATVYRCSNPDSGSATEEIEWSMPDPLDIGFNSRDLLDIAGTSKAMPRC